MRNVLAIGGSRHFGRHLVTLLPDAGTRVALLSRGSVPAPDGVRPLIADRADRTDRTSRTAASFRYRAVRGRLPEAVDEVLATTKAGV
nr:hypothetical protein OG296_35400 [Streptomyces sp. NBC_01001]